MVESLLLATIHVVSTSWSGVYIVEFLALVLASIFPFLHFLFSIFLAWCLGYAHGFYDSYPFYGSYPFVFTAFIVGYHDWDHNNIIITSTWVAISYSAYGKTSVKAFSFGAIS